MDPKSLLVFGALGVAALGAVAFGVAFVVFGNLAIHRAYSQKAQRLLDIAASEGVLYAEDGVAIRAKWTAPFAVAVRRQFADIRITSTAIYLIQYRRMFGYRMSQPVLAAVRPGAALPAQVSAVVTAVQLNGPPRWEGEVLVLVGRLRRQHFSIRVLSRNFSALARLC